MNKWYDKWICDRCGSENILVLGNHTIYTSCGCGRQHFNNIEFTVTDDGAIIEYD